MTTHSKSKIPVNLDNYPALKELAEDNQKEFLQILKGIFLTMDAMVEAGHHKTAKKYFGISIQDLTAQLLDAMFDHRGIMNSMPVQDNADLISDAYTHTLNPLHAAFDATDLKDRNFKPVSFEEKFGMKKDEFTPKDFIQSLLFYSYYGDLKIIGQYMLTNDHSLFDEEKHENIDKLIQIRPALTYQQAIGILPGKLIKGTGFFDCGDAKGLTTCPACKSPEGLILLDGISACTECKGGYSLL
mgnify:CR=1 FL=1